MQEIAEQTEEEVAPDVIWKTFEAEFLEVPGRFELVRHRTVPPASDGAEHALVAVLRDGGQESEIHGFGVGPIDGFVHALRTSLGVDVHVAHYSEHGLGEGEDAVAVAYVEVSTVGGRTWFGVGRHPSIVTATLRAVLAAVNRAEKAGALTSAAVA